MPNFFNRTSKHKVLRDRKKVLISGFFGFLIIGGSTSLSSKTADNHFVNLKVLPKNISSKLLNQIMVDEFSDALGVSCMFCHAEDKSSHKVDYSSDANPQKAIARKMMKMMLKINRQYFTVKHPVVGDSNLVVTCLSCHHGNAFPFPPE
jgi:hypothetical protein